MLKIFKNVEVLKRNDSLLYTINCSTKIAGQFIYMHYLFETLKFHENLDNHFLEIECAIRQMILLNTFA